MVRPAFRALVALAVAGTMAGCGDTETQPTPTPTPTNFTDTFSGTLTQNGAATYTFLALASGQVTASIAALTPDTAVIGFSLGTWSGSTCQTILANDRATLSSRLIGQINATGTFCVRVYDALGSVADPATYEVQVVHP